MTKENYKKMMDVLKTSSERQFDPKETFALLKANTLWLMTWGAKKFTYFSDTALFFTVSGIHHKGIVLITLAYDDTYTVRLLSSQWNQKAIFENVYFDELAELIDNKVERIPAYTK